MAKKKVETWPKHKMGKHCGYEENEDGSIQVAPSHSNEFERIHAEQQALDEFLASIARVSQPMAKAIAEARKRWWKDMAEDYELKLEDGYEYSWSTRTVRATKGKEVRHE